MDMRVPNALAEANDLSTGSSIPPRLCPHCGGPLKRIKRHALDRMLSVLRPVWRYRCMTFGCSWEGRLRRRR